MSSEKTKISNDLANEKANGEQICDEKSEGKPHTSEDPPAPVEAKSEAVTEPASEETVEDKVA